jgi:CRP-like cAMP-binding protein
VQAVATDYLGNRSIIQSVSPSEMFCEEFVASDTDSLPVSFIASEKSEVMLIGCESILHTCENACGFHHTLIYNLMKALAKKTVAFHDRIEITSKRTTREKLLTYLSIVAKQTGKTTFEIPFNRQELADYLEVERSGLSSEIGKLIRCGMIKADKRQFTVYF